MAFTIVCLIYFAVAAAIALTIETVINRRAKQSKFPSRMYQGDLK